ncbi:MAG TPA: amidase domain-containing protein [Bacillota bacterium]|nr:amidase domain-containing protein [Bacillota bacterium]
MGKLESYWLEKLTAEKPFAHWWDRKQELLKERGAEMIRLNGDGRVFSRKRYDGKDVIQYLLHLSLFIKQRDYYYMEELIIPYRFVLIDGEIKNHEQVRVYEDRFTRGPNKSLQTSRTKLSKRFSYDRRAAVQYAEYWWNSYNPAYERFSVDCTNFVSQCLAAGGAPMWGAPVRERGWWYKDNDWSFSWSVAHSLRWYLSGSTSGLTGREVERVEDLLPGDVICYDFQGDGRWDHTTIVVAKDANGMPLVNAHTDNSRHRYWSYEDSTAWTPNIQYKFFTIGE